MEYVCVPHYVFVATTVSYVLMWLTLVGFWFADVRKDCKRDEEPDEKKYRLLNHVMASENKDALQTL